MVRISIIAAASIACLSMAATPSIAKDTPKNHFTQEGAKGYCNEKGGTFWATPDGADYGCGYKGGGGLLCDKDAGCSESDGKPEERGVPWGALGLIGLVGLFGRKRG